MQQKHNSPPSSEVLLPPPKLAPSLPWRLSPHACDLHIRVPCPGTVQQGDRGQLRIITLYLGRASIANAPGNVLVIPSRPRKIINRAMVVKASGAETGAVAGAFQDNTQRFLVAAM
ncbi:hypothetical protein A9K55_001000 [Cordyceps militaris]|uniref:Uncharacterized protein n=1 Tax=Cordyceps militaris TaxID=73501 RepID=A0A2H4STF1_CORMI|nr:hypothetical protein A9K55_001000 [Cordyceps militaris]